MVRIDCFVFGYRKIKIEADKLSVLTSVFINYGISSSIGNDGEVIVRERDISKIKDILQGRMEYSCSEPLGLYGKWLKLRHKGAIIISLMFSLAIVLSSTLLVWDVRVDGNEKIPESQIIYELSRQGFEVGCIWRSVDLGEVESSFLRNNDGVCWININRRGTVAYVSVIERLDSAEESVDAGGYSNIVASEDCVVEEITVKSGTAMVKPGDTVRKGDVLIAGIYSAQAGGFCKANGRIIGRVNDRIEVNLQKNQALKVLSGKRLYSINLKIFNFSINIFKLYRNLTNECDIIDYEKSYMLFGRCRLPFSISLKYITEYELQNVTLGDDEIVKIASNRLDGLVKTRLIDCDLIKMKTDAVFTDNGYYIYSDVTFLCDVGEEKDFEAD